MRRSAAHTVLVLVLCSAAWGAEGPVAVSPGDPSKLALIGDTCPSFSWGGVTGAESYDLVVYRLGEEGEEAQQVLTESFTGSALSWTPSLDRCLDRGAQYAWSIRAVGRGEASGWSPPSLFRVASGRSEAEFEEAVEVVKRYLAHAEPGAPGAPPSVAPSTPAKGRRGDRGHLGSTQTTHGQGSNSIVISNDGILINGRPVVTGGGRVVFLTSTVYSGNLGGLAGADAKCNDRAGAAGLPGSFKAWLSNASCGPANVCRMFTQDPVGPYTRVDGVVVTPDWGGLTSGLLRDRIFADEFGVAFADEEDAWTGTAPNGQPLPGGVSTNCADWLAGAGTTGQYGCAEQIGTNWTECSLAECFSNKRIYCVEQ